MPAPLSSGKLVAFDDAMIVLGHQRCAAQKMRAGK